jgi:hypothetical protein
MSSSKLLSVQSVSSKVKKFPHQITHKQKRCRCEYVQIKRAYTDYWLSIPNTKIQNLKLYECQSDNTDGKLHTWPHVTGWGENKSTLTQYRQKQQKKPQKHTKNNCIKLLSGYVYKVYTKHKCISCWLESHPHISLCVCKYFKIFKNLISKTLLYPSISHKGYSTFIMLFIFCQILQIKPVHYCFQLFYISFLDL